GSTCGCPNGSRLGSRRQQPVRGCRSTPGSCAPRPPRRSGPAPTGPALRRADSSTGGGPASGPRECTQTTRRTAMPTFDTPQPISVNLELGVGDIRIAASDRDDTVVEVRPTDPGKKADVTAAEQTRVEYVDGRLLVKAPKGFRQYGRRGDGESIDVEIAL